MENAVEIKDTEEASIDIFLVELTLLSRNYGLAINGSPELVLMDPEDSELSYKADGESRIILC